MHPFHRVRYESATIPAVSLLLQSNLARACTLDRTGGRRFVFYLASINAIGTIQNKTVFRVVCNPVRNRHDREHRVEQFESQVTTRSVKRLAGLDPSCENAWVIGEASVKPFGGNNESRLVTKKGQARWRLQDVTVPPCDSLRSASVYDHSQPTNLLNKTIGYIEILITPTIFPSRESKSHPQTNRSIIIIVIGHFTM